MVQLHIGIPGGNCGGLAYPCEINNLCGWEELSSHMGSFRTDPNVEVERLGSGNRVE